MIVRMPTLSPMRLVFDGRVLEGFWKGLQTHFPE
jgi:hypothetical protein